MNMALRSDRALLCAQARSTRYLAITRHAPAAPPRNPAEARDATARALRQLGWKVLVVWECRIRSDLMREVQRINRSIREFQSGE
ncbi:MAG: hypothetical protein WCK74_04505 [Gemmatimonadaceae bacterium]